MCTEGDIFSEAQQRNFAVGAVGCLGSATNCATVSRKPRLGDASVLGNRRINLVGPGEDAAFQVEDFAEARLAQEVHSLGGTLSASAIRHDFPRGIQFANAPRHLSKWKQMSLEMPDLISVGILPPEDDRIHTGE